MTTRATDEQKEVEYYSAAVTAWFATALEYDKSLLTLSAGGIGLHLTLLTTVGLRSAEALILYIGAILSFTAALLAVLRVFRLNQTHIEDIVLGRVTGKDPALARLDLFAIVCFGIGVVFTAVVGIGAAVYSFSEKENPVANNVKTTQGVPTFDSVNGAAKLQPSSQLGKSFNGAASIQPTSSQPPPQVVTSQAPAPVPAPQAQPASQGQVATGNN